ncbi:MULTISPECIES: hypothetical protein [unclassified Arcicella]|uniref:hypothetical protein n=1 Tax=unclassified Arcicella TaxID=2644986 RepID=UPI002862B5CB|nr:MULTISPECIES: hypothetical protein [unclassified Arcicella]MDR6564362.1 hypothetical protein [Arcicella sp. BE51]MDR6814112.1 hypothetical protein [Arcicella sp. BE140]MDR6825424.1 hypothetical protein [Arcicella sp. BE139]
MRLFNFLIASIIICLTLWNCGHKQSETTEQDTTIVNQQNSTDTLAKILAMPDTNEHQVTTKHFIFTFEPSTKDFFDKTNQATNLIPDSTKLEKVGLKWFGNLADGTKKNIATNDTTEGFDTYAVYEFIGVLAEQSQWVFQVNFYESIEYVLIDMHTGKHMPLYGFPVVSPDKKWIISSNADLVAGESENAFNLIQITPQGLIVKDEVTLKTRGINQLKWINNTTLVVKETFLQNDEELIRYAKLYIQKK